jgi:hypothetical protein
VGRDDRVVDDAHDSDAVGGGTEVTVARLGHAPGGLGVRALATRAALGGVDAGVGEELVEVTEALDVADLGEDGRHDRRSHARDRLEPAGELAIEEARDAEELFSGPRGRSGKSRRRCRTAIGASLIRPT